MKHLCTCTLTLKLGQALNLRAAFRSEQPTFKKSRIGETSQQTPLRPAQPAKYSTASSGGPWNRMAHARMMKLMPELCDASTPVHSPTHESAPRMTERWQSADLSEDQQPSSPAETACAGAARREALGGTEECMDGETETAESRDLAGALGQQPTGAMSRAVLRTRPMRRQHLNTFPALSLCLAQPPALGKSSLIAPPCHHSDRPSRETVSPQGLSPIVREVLTLLTLTVETTPFAINSSERPRQRKSGSART